METSTEFPLLKVIALILFAAFFAAAETSLFSLSRFQLRQIKQRAPKAFHRIRYMLDRPAALVATLLLGNECVNMLTSNLLASYYEKSGLPSFLVALINIATVMPLILIFGEVTPKVIAAKSNIKVSQMIMPPFWLFYKMSLPFRFIIENIVNLFTFWLKAKHPGTTNIKEEDFLILLEEGKNKGDIESAEQELIENIFDMDDDNVLEIATPLKECVTVHEDAPIKTALELIRKNFSARMPVIGANGHVVGILYAKDILKFLERDEEGLQIKNMMKDPLCVESTMKVEALFRRLRQMKIHIAIVEDKSGKSLAMVTMEDVLEQMFGELWEDSE